MAIEPARDLSTARLRLRLRPLTAADADLLFELDSDPEVMRWLSGGSGTPMAVIRERVIPAVLAHPLALGYGCWCVFDAESAMFVGWVSLRPDGDPVISGELGYRFRRAAWGRGFATEAARAMLTRAFDEMELLRVIGNTYEANLGSRRVMEKLGMAVVRRYRPTAEELSSQTTYQPGDEDAWDGDDIEYPIEGADWLRQRG